MKKKILFHFPGLMNNALFNKNARDNCLEPFVKLKDHLASLGYELTTADSVNLENCVSVWFWDTRNFENYSKTNPPAMAKYPFVKSAWNVWRRRHLPELYLAACRAGLHARTVLFTGEPPSVLPENFNRDIHQLFGKVFTWHDDFVDGEKYFKFRYPQPETFFKVLDVPYESRRLLVNISARKHSTHSRELYSARLRFMRLLDSFAPEEASQYGPGWDQETPPLRCYRGLTANKWDVYPHFKFGLCYENIRDEPGYVTEKIFDCLRANCVPIYLGANNVGDYVDHGAFIDRRQFSSDEALIEFISGMSKASYYACRNAGAAYLQSLRYRQFESSAFSSSIVDALRLDSQQL